ncbi:MAG TPA: ABC transporter ATP-binding protein [Candidatus Dormibacteraeota bacterium]|nr:ABC transporter ATP-binding protein [Candidatus Dormibacteraeota bacterium]
MKDRSAAGPGAAATAEAAADTTARTAAPILMRGMRYRYAGARDWALDGIDLEVGAGEVVGVVGANESGKSTLCLVAAGLAPGVVGGTLEGSVRLLGAETATLAPSESAQRAGILFQDAGTQLTGTATTVWEEVAFGPRNLGLSLGEVAGRVEASLDAVGIAPLAPRDPGRLSGGQAQLVALASVLAMRPACLVLDEPTSQLDPQGTALVGTAIARLAREAGSSVLLVEHKTGLLARLADRVVVLGAGRVVRSGTAAAVLGDPRLAALGLEPPPAPRLRAALEVAGLDALETGRAVAAIELESRG